MGSFPYVVVGHGQRRIPPRLKVPWTPAAYYHGACVEVADLHPLPASQVGHDLDVQNKVLLEFLSPAIVRGGDAELKAFPLERKSDMFRIDILSARDIQNYSRWFVFDLIIGRRVAGVDGVLQRYGDELDRFVFGRLGG